jgi:tRNA(Ile)-lysidine synthase
MAPRRGRLVRPLLAVTREEVREYCRARGLEWREDPSNEDLRFARARVRSDVLPALRELNPAAERTIADTAAQLRDEGEVLESLAALALDEPLTLALLRELPPALARLVLRRAAGGAALSRRDAERILALGESGTGAVELTGDLRAVVEYGAVRFDAGAPGAQAPPTAPARLEIPGRLRFGSWEVEARPGAGGQALLDAGAVAGGLTVRGWRHGDRMRPAGLGGTKSLQDLFTDRKVPREERASVPVVEAGGEIAWVAGVAVGERFRADNGATVSLSARRSA